MSKPSLHDIAAMPFPKSEQALEKYYGVKPRRGWTEGDLQTFRVRISYSWRTTETVYYDIDDVDVELASND